MRWAAISGCCYGGDVNNCTHGLLVLQSGINPVKHGMAAASETCQELHQERPAGTATAAARGTEDAPATRPSPQAAAEADATPLRRVAAREN
jgi:hypothetical protein